MVGGRGSAPFPSFSAMVTTAVVTGLRSIKDFADIKSNFSIGTSQVQILLGPREWPVMTHTRHAIPCHTCFCQHRMSRAVGVLGGGSRSSHC